MSPVDFDKTDIHWSEPGADKGEDRWILSQFPEGYLGTAVELGALDGHYLSNTLLLEQKGWTVLCIEPNPVHHEDLKKNRKLVLTCACGAEPRVATLYADPSLYGETLSGLEPLAESGYNMAPTAETRVRTLDECLATSGFTRLDVISLDVDGDELAILQTARLEKWKPQVICVEIVHQIGKHSRAQANQEIHAFLDSLGYTVRIKMGHNSIYARAVA
jgi:FkbM family methyltransferase